MPSEKTWQHWLERLYDLRRDKTGAYELPHKSILLIAILDLFDRGILCHNQVPLSPELIRTFDRYFDLVRNEDDLHSIEAPFCRLADDGFWQVLAKFDNQLVYQPGNGSRIPGTRILRDAYGRFDDELWTSIVTYAQCRRQLRDALVFRYFPQHRDKFDAFLGKQNPLPIEMHGEAPGRQAAFTRIVQEIYDHRCAACGIRVRTSDGLSLVTAAHIIPFKQSQSDNPDNGLALCPNHRWALDSFLIAPCPDAAHKAGIWRVRPDLDPQDESHQHLAALAGRPVMAPNEEKFLPAMDGLRWREESLRAAVPR